VSTEGNDLGIAQEYRVAGDTGWVRVRTAATGRARSEDLA
jgi:hypothetical protein